MPDRFIPVCEPLLDGNELDYVTDAVRTGWISSAGKYVAGFEEAFGKYLGAEHAVSCSSGTAALHLACKAVGIGPGVEVIVPDFTMIASAFAVQYCGATPVFVDCDRRTWNIDVNLLEDAITPRTRAIMPVHIYGHPCDMDPIMDLARQHDLVVIEDAAEAIGSEYRGRLCGSIGHIGCFSFYANKTITCGEGGMVVTNLPEVADKARYYRNMCFPLTDAREYRHEETGFNYRMPNTVAAIGLAQTERVGHYVECRRRNARRYNDRLRDVKGLATPVEEPWAVNSYWMYGILVEDEFGPDRDAVVRGLRDNGVDTRKFFQPMHVQECMAAYVKEGPGSYPITNEIAARGLYLPSGSALAEEQIEHVCSCLRELQAA